MEDLYNRDAKILCPYNSSHHIRRCKMVTHLSKCRQNSDVHELVPCDFNSNHMVPKPEIQYHHDTCTDRRIIEQKIVESKISNARTRFPIANVQAAQDESWDNMNSNAYNPQQHTESKNIVRQLGGASVSKRKNFRNEERVRLSELEYGKHKRPNLDENIDEDSSVYMRLPAREHIGSHNRDFTGQNALNEIPRTKPKTVYVHQPKK